jgi:hypothetical protein
MGTVPYQNHGYCYESVGFGFGRAWAVMFWRRLVVELLWTDDGCVDWMGGLLSDLLCSTHMRAYKQIFTGTFSICEPEIYNPFLSKLICRRYRESIELRIWQLFTTFNKYFHEPHICIIIWKLHIFEVLTELKDLAHPWLVISDKKYPVGLFLMWNNQTNKDLFLVFRI